jgi:integrase
MTRSIFKYGFENGLIERPIVFGYAFRKPSAKTLRKNRMANGPKMFTPTQIRFMLEIATVNMKAMILLAINGGLGNTDLALLPLSAIDFKGKFLTYPRSKTAIMRKIPLWSETIRAIRMVIKQRNKAKIPKNETLLFIGRRGTNYVCNNHGYRVNQEAQRIIDKADIKDRTFYDLRRTFQTVAEGSRDLSAVQSIMGHAPAATDMSAVYRQLVEDDRLQAVVAHVHAWLFGS